MPIEEKLPDFPTFDFDAIMRDGDANQTSKDPEVDKPTTVPPKEVKDTKDPSAKPIEVIPQGPEFNFEKIIAEADRKASTSDNDNKPLGTTGKEVDKPLGTPSTEDTTGNTGEDIDDTPLTKEELVERFELAVDLGSLIVPDDFKFDGTEESLEQAIELDQAYRITLAEDDLRSRIKDPRVFELIEHGIKGGDFANIDKVITLQKEASSLETLDLTDPEICKTIITQHMSGTGLSKDRINDAIETYEDKGKLEEVAKDVVGIALKRLEEEKKNVKVTSEKNQKAEVERQSKFEKTFMEELNKGQYASTKKQQILSAFSPVKLTNGQEVSQLQYKYQQVISNPIHFLKLVEFLSEYDSDKGFSTQRQEQQETTRKSQSKLSLLRRPGTTRVRSSSSIERTNQQPQAPVNPLNKNVKIL